MNGLADREQDALLPIEGVCKDIGAKAQCPELRLDIFQASRHDASMRRLSLQSEEVAACY
jgi:hypothetical protein